MRTRKSFLEGWRAFWSSFQFIRQRGLKGWYIAFALTTFFVWACVAFVWWCSLTQLRDALLASAWLEAWRSSASPADVTPWAMFLGVVKIGIAQGLKSIAHVLFAVATLFLNLKVTKFLVLACLGPLIAMLSERASQELNQGSSKAWSWELMMRGLVRGAKSAMLMFIVEVGLGMILTTVGVLVAAVLPFLAPFIAALLPILFLSVGSWFYGAAMFDCIWERQGLGSRKGLQRTWGLGGSVVGLGLPLYVFMTIPFLALPFGLILGPIGGGVGAVLIEEH